MPERYHMLAGYNAWANERLYDAASMLPDKEYRADRGAFFGSLHGTLNHILIGDRIWMRRFTGSGEAPDRLDAILYNDLEKLREARRAEDLRISRYCNGINTQTLEGDFSYRTITKPSTVTQKLAPALDHFFNHQTHHRGQAHCLLTAIGGREAAPSLDLILFQRETGLGGTRQHA
jgi:uncharacterized damage-inducible protein DinB